MTIADYFNGAVVAHAIAAADQLGILDRIIEHGQLRIDGSEEARLGYLVSLLQSAKIVQPGECDGDFLPGQNFDDAKAFKSYFTWLFSASGEMLINGAQIIRGERSAEAIARDGAAIARATAEFGRLHIDPSLLTLGEWRSSSVVADLGCGNASRLLHLVEEFSARGIGIDISPKAVQSAREIVAGKKMSDRIVIMRGDIRALEFSESFRDVNILLCCLAGHDLWPRDDCVRTLRGYLEIFPGAENLVLCETVRSERGTLESNGIPAIGYEYLHYLMGQYIPSEREWVQVLSEGGWPLSHSLAINVPDNTRIFVCRAER